MKIRSQILGIGLALLALSNLAGNNAKAAEIEFGLSSHETYVGMPVTAYLKIHNPQNPQQPQFPQIEGVDIESSGSPSHTSQTTVINGQVLHDESLTYAWRLTPRKQQKFEIPAFKVEVDGQTFTTEKTAFVANKSDTGDLMFVEVVGQRKEVFVGEPIKLTLKIWIKPYRDLQHNVRLSADDTLSLLNESSTNWGVFRSAIEELAKQRQPVEASEVLRADSDGIEHSYYLYEIDHIIYPQKAGQLEVGDIQIVAGYPTSIREREDFFSRRRLSLGGVRPLVAEAKVEPITVKPVPTAGMPADYRGAIGRYQISTQAMPTKVKVGDQITLRIEIGGGERLDLLQAPPLSSLPQLTRDFKVTEEPLAGMVRDKTKLFVATLRPLRTDVKEIPAIPFSSFDPETKEFVTAKSTPIPLEVSPADELALSKIISANGMSSSSTSSGDETAEVINPLTWQFRGNSVLHSSRPPSDNALWFALAVPPLAFLGLFALRQSRSWLRDSSMWRRWQAKRLAARRLDHADSSEAVARAAFGYVADRFGLNAAPLTRRELVHELQHHGVSAEAVSQWDELLSQCENAKYAGGLVSPPQELARHARNCIAGIDQHCCSKGETQCSA